MQKSIRFPASSIKLSSEETIVPSCNSVLVFGYAAGGLEYPGGRMHVIYDGPKMVLKSRVDAWLPVYTNPIVQETIYYRQGR